MTYIIHENPMDFNTIIKINKQVKMQVTRSIYESQFYFYTKKSSNKYTSNKNPQIKLRKQIHLQ